MKKIILFFILTVSLYPQNTLVRRSELTAVYDSLNSRTDSVIIKISQLASTQTIDGWYRINLTSSSSDPLDVNYLYRGFTPIGNRFNVGVYSTLKKMGAVINNDSTNGEIKVYLYKNNVNTGANVTLTRANKNLQIFDRNICTFAPGDYFDLRATYETYGAPITPDIEAYVILETPLNADYTYRDVSTSTTYTITLNAVDSGTVSLYDADWNAITNGADVNLLGDTIYAVAIPHANFSFICWTGVPLVNESDRFPTAATVGDTLTYVVTGDATIRARFKKTIPTYRVIISDPCRDEDSLHAKIMRAAFLSGYNYVATFVGLAEFTQDSILIYKTIYPEGNLDDTYLIADKYGADIVIQSLQKSIEFAETSKRYYPTLTFVSVGSNTHYQKILTYGDLPTPIITGACNENVQTDTNEIAWDIEIFSGDPNALSPDSTTYGSYSNAYIAGWYMLGLDYFNYKLGVGFNDISSVRQIWRISTNLSSVGAFWTNKNGYGYRDGTWSTGALAHTVYLNKVLYNKYYFRENDPYYQR